MRAYISQLLREGLINESIFKDVTNIPDYDRLKDGEYNKIPSRYSNMVAYVKHMSPKDYLSECAKIQGTTYEEQLKYISDNNVSKLIGLIESGVKLDMPYLNYYDDLQEGRHRAKAAMELGIDKIPVLIIDDKGEVANSSDVIWGDVVNIGDNKYIKFNVGTWGDIYKVLEVIRDDWGNYLLDLSFKHYIWGIDINKMLVDEIEKWMIVEWMKSKDIDKVDAINILRDIVKYNADLLGAIMHKFGDNVVGLRIWNIDSDYSSGYEMLVGGGYYSDINFKSIY